MWFDVKAAPAEIGPTPVATLAANATISTGVADVAAPPDPSDPERDLAHIREAGQATYGAATTASS